MDYKRNIKFTCDLRVLSCFEVEIGMKWILIIGLVIAFFIYNGSLEMISFNSDSEVIDQDNQSIEDTSIGRPSNEFGEFDCKYDSDCNIYFDCSNCYCDGGVCYGNS